MSLFSKLQIKIKQYFVKRRAFIIGKRGAMGYNIYLTFGSEKTVSKNAEDSYHRYAMAMKHYNQDICDREHFIKGYNVGKLK